MTNTAVLVLNRSFFPVHITTVKRAFALLMLDVAHALDRSCRVHDFESWASLSAAEGDDLIRTVSRAIVVPRVIVLQLYDRLPGSRVRFSRQNIYGRDDNTCQYCARKLPRSGLNLDHIVPRSQGGRTTWENIVCCCLKCNLRKGGRTPAQAGMALVRKPVKPKWTPLVRAPGGRPQYREWLPFLRLVDAAYWNVELVD